MDVNGTKFHLLLGASDWFDPGGPPSGLQWNPTDHTISLKARPFVVPPRLGDTTVGIDQRRGAGRDRFGHWYWVGDDLTQIRMLPHGGGAVETYWPVDSASCPDDDTVFGCTPEPPVVETFRGLAVTTTHRLVVGAPESGGLLVFDLASGGPPRRLCWPDGLDVRPWDLAADGDGGLWVLDIAADALPRPPRLWHLNRWLQVENTTGTAPATPAPPTFVPKGAIADEATSGVTVSAAMAVELVADRPISVDVLDDGDVIVLDRRTAPNPPRLQRFHGGVLSTTIDLDLPGHGQAHDMTVVVNSRGTTIYVVDAQGDQAFAFDFVDDVISAVASDAQLPLRLFSGKSIVTAAGRAYYDLGEQWLPIVDWNRPSFERSAQLVTDGFDGHEPGCVWHRVIIDAWIPAGTSVEIEARAAEDPDELYARPWRREPPLHRRPQGPEQPNHRFGAPQRNGRQHDGSTGSFEVLCQHAVGRFLQLRLTLSGNGRRTPKLWALRLHYPRFSYLDNYLPDTYRRGEDRGDFLDRYLANAEGTLTTIEDRIATFQTQLDLSTTDAEYFGWLASFFGTVLDPGWSADRQRLFLRHAAELLARRGTVRGLLELLRLVLEPCPDDSIFDPNSSVAFGVRLIERFRVRASAGVVHGDPTDLVGPYWVSSAREAWNVADGRARLQELYTEFLDNRYQTIDALITAWQLSVHPGSFAGLPFPTLTPTAVAQRADWRDFVRTRLAVHYAEVGASEAPDYRVFLAQRYRRPDGLDAAWGLMGTNQIGSFDDVQLPTTLPGDGAALSDWIDFVSLVVPAQRAAHGFTVLVPIDPEEPDADRDRRLALAERIVDEARPAHTWFDVRPYWAALRVGEARVGLETVVGEGSRFAAMWLGGARLAQGYLSGGPNWEASDRFVVGRAPLSVSVAPSEGEPPHG